MKEIFDRNLRHATTLAIILILALVPFHAFLTVYAASILGHYTLLRLWKEALLLVAMLGAIWILIRNPALFRRLKSDLLFQFIGLFVALYALSAVVALVTGKVNLEAAAYGALAATRFLVFFTVVWVASGASGRLWRWRYKLLLVPAVVVVAFGVLQKFLLPYDFLRHFGYGPDTIRPYQTIDKKTSYFRIISTLRGANPLGAYLVVVLGACTAQFFARLRKSWMLVLALASVLVLAATYSRSAWIGAFAAVGIITASKLKHLLSIRRAILISVLGTVVIGGSLALFRNNDFVQNTFFHTDEHSVAATSSNHDHASASRIALKDIVREPFGRGTGTAGQASVYNTGYPARIAENYYLQVAQEVGIFGLLLFITICVLVGKRLYEIRQDPLALGLLAGFIGLVVVNLLSHAWADDTLAYVWWGFAGLVLGAQKERIHEAKKA